MEVVVSISGLDFPIRSIGTCPVDNWTGAVGNGIGGEGVEIQMKEIESKYPRLVIVQCQTVVDRFEQLIWSLSLKTVHKMKFIDLDQVMTLGYVFSIVGLWLESGWPPPGHGQIERIVVMVILHRRVLLNNFGFVDL